MQKSGSWGERNKPGETGKCPTSLPEEFPDHSTEHSDLAKLKRQSLEFKEAKASRIVGTEYRGKDELERDPLSLWLSTELH